MSEHNTSIPGIVTESIVSHSEVDAYLACRRKHFYSFANGGLEPIKTNDALYRGIKGHKAMEIFFKAIQVNFTWDEALAKMQEWIVTEMTQANANLPILQDVQRLTVGFLLYNHERMERWQVLHVEGEFWLPLGADIQYPFKPDLIIQEGPHIVVVDWKFIYDFYSDEMTSLLPQLAKYIGALRALGIWVKRGLYAQVRYRKMKDMSGDSIYRLHEVPMTNARIKQTFLDQIATTQEIAMLKALPIEEWDKKATRSASSWNCKMCSFRQLCGAELNGSDGRLIRQIDYRPNSYGYHRKDV